MLSQPNALVGAINVSHLHIYTLNLSEVIDSIQGILPTKSRLLVATEREAPGIDIVVVDPAVASLQLGGNAVSSLDVTVIKQSR